ncbi:MAG: 4Fe-4S binding protein [Candidatus Lokiarchaeota archaeon]|nr:4Fe-4S binding protein [Candidatus Lokiarchaeota archaeon]
MSQIIQKLREKKITIIRRVVQIVSFLIINYIIIETIFSINLLSLEGFIKVLPVINTPRNPLSEGSGILEYIFYSIAQGIFPLLLIAIFVLIILFTARFFCGWVCPIGTIQDGLTALPIETKTMKISTHNSLVKVKYFFVVILILIIVPLGITKYTDIAFYIEFRENLGDFANKPFGFFSLSEFIFVTLPNILVSIWQTGGLTPIFSNLWTFIIFFFFLVILILSVWYPRMYCRYFCPFGALASVLSSYSFLKLSRSPVRCVGRQECGICEKVCPKQIRILDEPFEFFTGDGECNLCSKCLEECPYDAIEIKFG